MSSKAMNKKNGAGSSGEERIRKQCSFRIVFSMKYVSYGTGSSVHFLASPYVAGDLFLEVERDNHSYKL